MLIYCTADAEKDADMKKLKSEEAITILKDMKVDIPVPKAAVIQIKRNAAIEMAIDALKAQADGDTISRQAVIEINRSYHGQMPNEVNHRIWKEINELPSAQPETHDKRMETHACDLISRQAAIGAIENTEWYHLRNNGVMMRGANSKEHQAWYKEQDIYKALEQLPPAQPDIDTVSRKEAIDAVLNLNIENRVSWRDAVIDTIDALPPSPSRPSASDCWGCNCPKMDRESARPKGEWIQLESGSWWCKFCGANDVAFKNHNFCPHCGADMRQQERGSV